MATSVATLQTFASVSLFEGDTVWTTPGNAGASDNAYAQNAILSSESDSQALSCLNPSWSDPIPNNARLDGIEVRIELKDASFGPDGRTGHIHTVRLRSGGAYAGDNRAADELVPLSEQYVTYGGAADKWGSSLTCGDLNDSSFGVYLVIQAQGGGTLTIETDVDHVEITAYFTPSVANWFRPLRRSWATFRGFIGWPDGR